MNTNTQLKLTHKATQAAIAKLSTFAATASNPKQIREFSLQQKQMLQSTKKQEFQEKEKPRLNIFDTKSDRNVADQFVLY